jgi:hypothetical protein
MAVAPTDPSLESQWSSRNPLTIPTGPPPELLGPSVSSVLNEMLVQSGRAEAALAQIKERDTKIWAYDYGQDKATVDGIRFAAALVLRNLSRVPENRVRLTPFVDILLARATTDAAEKSVLAACLLGLG